jgi:hypothetical protein
MNHEKICFYLERSPAVIGDHHEGQLFFEVGMGTVGQANLEAKLSKSGL